MATLGSDGRAGNTASPRCRPRRSSPSSGTRRKCRPGGGDPAHRGPPDGDGRTSSADRGTEMGGEARARTAGGRGAGPGAPGPPSERPGQAPPERPERAERADRTDRTERTGATAAPAQDKWYFTREQLAASPSRNCGLDPDKELAYRQQAANLIQDMGQRLQVSQLCINTAIVYMHRFYAFHSFTQFHRNAMAAAALFLAAKVEEQPRKLEHVIRVAHMCLHRGEGQPTLDTQSKLYIDQTQDLVFNENVLLQTLGFDVAIDHPHTHVVHACDLILASKDLAQTSYFMASNSLHLTTMCLQYKPTVVACFCIHLASKWSNWAIPQSNEGKHWFYYVDRTVTSELLERLTAEFLHIFDRCPARLKKKIMSISNSQGTNSPQQAGSSHGNSSAVPSSPFDKEPRKITAEELEKLEYDNRQLGLFCQANSSSSLAPQTTNKIDLREYKERQPHQQQDRRRPPSMPLSGSRPQDSSSNSQPRPPSGSQRMSQNVPSSQHRWPSNQRSKDPGQPMRSHPSSSQSSRPHHRSSSSGMPPQLPPQPSPMPDQRAQSRSQPPAIQPPPPPHPSRMHSQQPPPMQPHNQMPQQTQQQQPPPPPVQHQQPPPSYQQPVQRPPSLFSPEPVRKQSVPRRPAMPVPQMKEFVPTPLSPFSISPPHSHPQSELETIVVKKEPAHTEPPSLQPSLISSNSVETDSNVVSTLLKASLSHRPEKKKKKEKHKHKDRDKKEERRKHKKKDKRRDSESGSIPNVSITPPVTQITQPSIPIKVTIPKEAYSTNVPPPAVKIKIPKDRLKAEPPPQGLKLKISKEMMMEASRKRPADPSASLDTMLSSHKAARLQQQHPHHQQQHKSSHGMAMGNGQSGSFK